MKKLTARQIRNAERVHVSTNAIEITYKGQDYLMVCRQRGKWVWTHPEDIDEPATEAQVRAALNR